MKKFKIAFIVNHFPSVSETFILNQITDLIDKGNDVKIFSLRFNNLHYAHESIKQYNLIEKTTYFQQGKKSGIKKFSRIVFYVLKNFWALSQKLKLRIFDLQLLKKEIRSHSLLLSLDDFFYRGNFDIVHVHFGQRGAIIADFLSLSKWCKIKFVVTFHGYDLNPSKINFYKVEYRNLFMKADALTVNTRYLESILLKVCSAPKKLVVLPAGLRTEQYKKRPLQNNNSTHFNIIYCGRFIELKAPDLALEIIHILVHARGLANIKLRMIGDGELRRKVEHLIDKLNLRAHVVLLGSLSQERVVEEMNNGHVFLLPGVHESKTGRAETQGLVIQEAQAMELPVVVSNVGGMAYGVLDGISGFVVRERDLVSFADKIEALIKNEELRLKMGKAGREFVMNNFDTKVLGDKLLQLYSRL